MQIGHKAMKMNSYRAKQWLPSFTFFVVQQNSPHSETTLIDTVCLAGCCYILMHVIYAKNEKKIIVQNNKAYLYFVDVVPNL